MARRRQRWSSSEEAILWEGSSVNGWEWFLRRLSGRSRAAIQSKAHRLFGSGLRRGSYTLAEIVRVSGYSLSQIHRAGWALRQKWHRTGPRGAYLVSEDQRDELLAWLRTDYWSKKHRLYACTWCAGTRRPHRWGGLCTRCAPRYRARFRRVGLPSSPVNLAACLPRLLGGPQLEEALQVCAQGRAFSPALARLILRRSRASCSNAGV